MITICYNDKTVDIQINDQKITLSFEEIAELQKILTKPTPGYYETTPNYYWSVPLNPEGNGYIF